MSKSTENLKKASVKELNNILVDLMKEKQKLETLMFKNNGTSTLSRNYPKDKQATPYGNLKRIKKEIARVKTFLNIKWGCNNGR